MSRNAFGFVSNNLFCMASYFGGAVINAVTAVLGVAVAISTVCNLAGYGFMQTDEGLYFGTIQQTRMRYQLDQEAGRAR